MLNKSSCCSVLFERVSRSPSSPNWAARPRANHESVSSAFTDGRTFADLIADLDSGRVHPLKDEQICALQKRVPDSIPKSCGRNHLASTNALGHL